MRSNVPKVAPIDRRNIPAFRTKDVTVSLEMAGGRKQRMASNGLLQVLLWLAGPGNQEMELKR